MGEHWNIVYILLRHGAKYDDALVTAISDNKLIIAVFDNSQQMMMKKTTVFLLLNFIVLISCGQTHTEEGVWVIDQEKSILGKGQTLAPSFDNTIFKYDGTYITMRLFFWSWTPYSADGFYKLKTKWSKDTLLYLSPMSEWEPLWEEVGVYKNKTFMKQYVNGNGDSCKWVFRKIITTNVIETDKAVLAKRELYKYSTKY